MTGDGAAGPGAQAISIAVTAFQGLAVGDGRQGFAILRGQTPISPDDVRVRLGVPDAGPVAVDVEKVEILRGPGGADDHADHDHEHPPGTEVNDIYVFHHTFERAGIYDLEVTFEDESGTASFQVLPDTQAPRAGEMALATASPTMADHRGVDPICTRTRVSNGSSEYDTCSMHDRTIAQAVESGRPSVIVFATPRFCTSRTCGPVVDFVQQQQTRVGDRAEFVHVEIWKDDGDSVNNPPEGLVAAFAEWALPSEPWIYFVGSDGVVKERWLGALGRDELARAVDELLAG